MSKKLFFLVALYTVWAVLSRFIPTETIWFQTVNNIWFCLMVIMMLSLYKKALFIRVFAVAIWICEVFVLVVDFFIYKDFDMWFDMLYSHYIYIYVLPFFIIGAGVYILSRERIDNWFNNKLGWLKRVLGWMVKRN